MENIKEMIEKVVAKVKNSGDLKKKLEENPAALLKDILGVDLPADIVNKVVDGVKAKITVDNAKDIFGSIKKLF